MKEIELIVDGDEDMISAMGLVSMPAIEIDAYYFKDDRSNYTFAKEIEEGIFVGPAMIAEKRIYRYNPYTNEEFMVYFSAETIKKLSQNFLIKNQQHNAMLEHETPINDVNLIYSWLVYNEHDPIITEFGYKDIAIGSWVVAYKIDNEEVREKIKSGEIGGFSVEGFFTEKFSKQLSDDQLLDEIRKLLGD